MTTSQGILFHGQVDDGNRKIHLKVFGPERMNCLLLFVRPDIPSISGVTLIADVTVNEHDLPMTFVSGSGSGYYYCLEMYGLKEEKDMKEHYTCLAYGGTQFLVAKIKNGKDIEISIRLKEAVSLQFPLRNNAEVIFPIQVYHRPVSRYSFCNNTKFKTDKIWIIFFKQSEDRLHVFIHVGQKLDFRLPFDLPVATICEVKVIGCILFNKKMRTSKKEMNSKMINFKTCFTKAEYETLYDKTLGFIKTRKGKFRSVKYFYRNKSEQYFHSITVNHNGIMKPYKKDHNGDPCSVINGRLDGLFFNTAMDSKRNRPLPCSPFGPVRLHITASFLFEPNLNLYFADFYCHYKIHYVTVILTRRDSPSDNFCKKRLKELDIYDNPFVCITTSNILNDIMVYHGNGLGIEVLYTEALNIHEIIQNQQGHFKRVPVIGRGESRPNGIPKNENCTVCNL
ncbi:uncharacterized protein LOC127725730 isoform X13 [Mytilus californianus]|uniref:uncharacterized protein LOC127725730 isoform X13 n=1 Tax=Mytilus californianus TaxID=6549 RepID=UPI00224828DA|nr:uncharacterized protein LOC127725730 isoform X13 [Mytilus californianus]